MLGGKTMTTKIILAIAILAICLASYKFYKFCMDLFDDRDEVRMP